MIFQFNYRTNWKIIVGQNRTMQTVFPLVRNVLPFLGSSRIKSDFPTKFLSQFLFTCQEQGLALVSFSFTWLRLSVTSLYHFTFGNVLYMYPKLSTLQSPEFPVNKLEWPVPSCTHCSTEPKDPAAVSDIILTFQADSSRCGCAKE